MAQLDYRERKRRLLCLISLEIGAAYMRAGNGLTWVEAKRQAVKEIDQALQILFPPEEPSK